MTPDIARDREQLAEGICPRSGERIMRGGILRPACFVCQCGEDGEADATAEPIRPPRAPHTPPRPANYRPYA